MFAADNLVFFKRWSLFLLLILSSGSGQADDFAACVVNLQQQAVARGVPSAAIEGALANVQYVPRVIELDRRQPEFTQTFAGYFNRRVTEQRVAKGREMLAKHEPLLASLATQYGVPAQYLVAFWGLETNYGSYLGKMPILDSLATLACDPRRSEYFTAELFEALQLLSQPGVSEPLLGSWAGAMGHTQFMPSAYRRYARDGDNDGRIDLWRSSADALTSGAHFLQQLGWQPGERWGREVLLPQQFAYRQLGLKQKRTLAEWRQQGVRSASGEPLPALDMTAALLLPSGYEGPAFLVYDNFEVIMRWNRSTFYALAVGHLADRINGAGTLRQPPPENHPRLSIAAVKQLQSRLNELGFNSGIPDGIIGPGTRQSIRAFQQSKNMVADGYPRALVFQALNIALD